MEDPDRRPTRRTRAKYARGERPTIEARLLGAMERLLEKGNRFASVSVEQLMEEAGMTRSSFYLHFRDRGELVSRLMQQVASELAESTGTWLANAESAHRSDMEKALVGMVQSYKKHQAILAAINDVAPHDENVATLYQDMVESLCLQARSSLKTVKRAGRSRPGATDDVADIMVWMVTMYCARFVGQRNGPDLKRLTKSLGYICGSVAFSDEDGANESRDAR